jgi:hypothetical protein
MSLSSRILELTAAVRDKLNSKADAVATQAALELKAPVSHTHTIANIGDLADALAARIQTVNGVAPNGAGNVVIAAGETQPVSVSFTRSGGLIATMTETFAAGPDRVTTYNRTAGVLTSMVQVQGTVTRTTPYTYAAGVLTGSGPTVES